MFNNLSFSTSNILGLLLITFDKIDFAR
jgi:hypothetical protein